MFALILAVKVGGRSGSMLEPRRLRDCRFSQPQDDGNLLWAPTCSSFLEKQVQQQRGQIDAREWRFLLAGPTGGSSGGSSAPPKPGGGWLTDRSWSEVAALSALPTFAGFDRHLAENEATYQAFFDSAKVGFCSQNGWELRV
jgi:hypothetical protein